MEEKLSFFDANCTVGMLQKNLPDSQLTEEQLVQVLDRCGIERALAVHELAIEIDVLEGNRRCSELGLHDPHFIPCYVALPEHTGEFPAGEKLLEYLYNGGARAVKLFPKRHRYSLLPPWGQNLLSTLESTGVPVVIDAAEIDLVDLHQLLAQHEGLTLILLRPWYRVDRLLLPLLETHGNLYVEISFYQPFRGIEFLAGRVGADRLLFGSGLPHFEPGSTVAALRYSELARADLEKIAHRNLENLLWRPQA